MKTYRITVNGVSYDVTVEESGASAPAAPVAAPAPAAAPAPKAAPAPAAAAGGTPVTAPMPGTILKINAAVGAQVKKGDILLILEAMKMENEIMAQSDGKVLAVCVKSGDTVEAGTTLVTIG